MADFMLGSEGNASLGLRWYGVANFFGCILPYRLPWLNHMVKPPDVVLVYQQGDRNVVP